MFYFSSKDKSVVPDSLFFLHRLGLLEHKFTRQLPLESLYYLENADPIRLFTVADVIPDFDKGNPPTVLVSDFVNETQIANLVSKKVLVLSHVYFDYIATIKSLYANSEIHSLKVLLLNSKKQHADS